MDRVDMRNKVCFRRKSARAELSRGWTAEPSLRRCKRNMGAPSGLPNINPVRISYTTLQNDPTSLYKSLAQAFGSDPGCLGIILVDSKRFLPPAVPSSLRRAGVEHVYRPEISSTPWIHHIERTPLRPLPCFRKPPRSGPGRTIPSRSDVLVRLESWEGSDERSMSKAISETENADNR